MSRRGENIIKHTDGRWDAKYINHYTVIHFSVFSIHLENPVPANE